jgi:hypothetical protein
LQRGVARREPIEGALPCLQVVGQDADQRLRFGDDRRDEHRGQRGDRRERRDERERQRKGARHAQPLHDFVRRRTEVYGKQRCDENEQQQVGGGADQPQQQQRADCRRQQPRETKTPG